MRFILCLLLLTSTNSFANYIRVIGVGKNYEEAKHNGFSQAIDLHVGTVVLSERELSNYNLIKNEILVYSSGYVIDFRIIIQNNTENQIQLIMDVLVNGNQISDRILTKSAKATEIDGEKLKSSIKTFIDERFGADRIVDNILKDYPLRVFNVEQFPSRITQDERNSRKLHLVIPYKITYNYNYLIALRDVLEKTQDNPHRLFHRPEYKIHIRAKAPNNFRVETYSFGFKDKTSVKKIKEIFENNHPGLMLNLYNRNNQVEFSYCFHTPLKNAIGGWLYWHANYERTFIIDGHLDEESSIRLEITDKLYKKLEFIQKVELKITRSSDCRDI